MRLNPIKNCAWLGWSMGLTSLCLAAVSPFVLSVDIVSPVDGATVTGMVQITGTSSDVGTGRVSISIDGAPFLLATGTDQWSFDWDTLQVSDGPHAIRARARQSLGGPAAFDNISVNVSNSGSGLQSFDYASSVDGEVLSSKLYLPQGFDVNGPPRPLVINLHGGGGLGTIVEAAQMDARNWVQIAPDGRRWGLADMGCNWRVSAAYVNNPDPNVGPGEQDILDAIDWTVANFPIDTDRVYLMGFSMGGRGAYIIGLKNAERFAAISPRGPAIDMFEIFVRRPQPAACKEGMLGGKPGDSLFVDTMYSVTSGRFLIENAYNLPIFHGHGLQDTTASNTLTNAPFLHGWHITSDTSFNACHSGLEFCFGHTPTLSELRTNAPGGYDWAFMFSEVGHQVDSRWALGAPIAPDVIGIEDAANPGHLLGAFDFFEARSLNHNPETVVFKTYEDEHQKSYWLELMSATPWLNQPAAVRARRDIAQNQIEVELARAAEIRFDLVQAQLALGTATPLALVLSPLFEPSFDPALMMGPGEALIPMVILRGNFQAIAGATVLLDGAPLPSGLLTVHPDEIRIGPITVDGTRLLEIVPIERHCSKQPNSAGAGAEITFLGSTSLTANDLQLEVNGLVPNTFGIFFYGPDTTDVAFGDGRLCITGGLHRLPPAIQADAAGNSLLALDLSTAPTGSGSGQINAGTSWSFQHWYRDILAGASGFNTSDALRMTFTP